MKTLKKLEPAVHPSPLVEMDSAGWCMCDVIAKELVKFSYSHHDMQTGFNIF